MELRNIFRKKQTNDQAAQEIVRDELMFLLMQNERRFTKLLLAHLLDEGCNLPIRIAKPQFYELMVSGLFAKADPETQKEFTQKFEINHSEYPQRIPIENHKNFFEAMIFFETNLDNAGKTMASEVINSIQTLKKEWALDDLFFHEGLEQFETRLQALMEPSWQGEGAVAIPFELVRRRLYIALTTSLLRYMKARKPFHDEFGSIPEVVNAMQQDHTIFCHVMAFFRENTPYFTYLASRIFWRTLETLRLEDVTENYKP